MGSDDGCGSRAHALCNVIEPVLDRRLIFDCWAKCRGKGTHRAVLRYQAYAQRYRFALKMDIRKYFPSIDATISSRRTSGRRVCLLAISPRSFGPTPI